MFIVWQVEAMLNCYVRPDQYDLIPSVPRLVKHGMEAFLVSYQAGQVLDIPGIELLRDLPSFRRMEMMTQPGSALHCTIDCFTRLVFKNNHLACLFSFI